MRMKAAIVPLQQIISIDMIMVNCYENISVINNRNYFANGKNKTKQKNTKYPEIYFINNPSFLLWFTDDENL